MTLKRCEIERGKDNLSEGAKMYLLHWEYMAGSIVVHALLQDARADFDLHYVDMGAGEHKAPDYLSINPTGRVPALTLPGGSTIGETGAIVTHLCEVFAQAGLSPQPGDTDRSEFLFWLNVMTTMGYPTVARWNHPERYAKSEAAIAEVERKASADLDDFFDIMEEAISGPKSFLKRGFSALDYYLSMLTEWSANRQALFAAHPKIEAVYLYASQRPAYRAAMNRHALPQAAA
ncbi:glutathione S-transferase family protein [Marimonas sp. MJW-29]|uniref:Glutathione S-transferase family protein n=1 Tax=Sulfitobacter sediminis TaxID=3234186 RepID=A0ABV3RUS7_9RHOB